MDSINTKTGPKDFFLWFATIIALYISAISLLTLLFQYIDILFVDPLTTYIDPYSGAIRLAIASLIIIFPIYIYLTRVLNEDIRQHPEKKDIGVRKWLIFLTLFGAGATVIIDLIVLINTFLGGQELTTGFLLKVVSVLVVIGGVFVYYLKDLKGSWETQKQTSQTIGAVVVVAVIASVVAGFFIIGSPATQRLMRIDQQKVQDLSSIQWQIISFYQQKERLPKSLQELEDPLIGFIVPTDIQTGKDYGYILGEGTSFKLCAYFNKESREYAAGIAQPLPTESSVRYGIEDINWTHGVGETCFERIIDPDKFPPLKR
jgi:hypothetical protein